MYSIGVDIGTSTTEIIISNINISTKLGPSLLPTTEIDDVHVIYQSPVIFTPFLTQDIIDFKQIRKNVQTAISESGIQKEEIETGAVIITGETARKDNAALVTKSLSEYLGDFVVATAGPKLESVLAGQGAGICEESKRRHKKILNLDIGGGTLNAALFDNGILKKSFAMDIGGRLIKVDNNHIVTYLSERIQFLIEEKKFSINPGKKVSLHELERLCEYLAEFCLQASGFQELSIEAKRLFITEISKIDKVDYVSVSGGVGEYVGLQVEAFSEEEALKFGDMGPILGKKITEAFTSYQDKLMFPKEKIRATVIGAGSHSLSISGSTVGFDESILPIRNIPIIRSPAFPNQWNDFYQLTKPLMELYEEDVLAVNIPGKISPSYEELKILARQITKLYEDTPRPIIVILKEDFAKALSQMIRIHTNYKKPVICLDKIHLEHGDYIDIGAPIGSALPVIIKTLIYQS